MGKGSSSANKPLIICSSEIPQPHGKQEQRVAGAPEIQIPPSDARHLTEGAPCHTLMLSMMNCRRLQE